MQGERIVFQNKIHKGAYRKNGYREHYTQIVVRFFYSLYDIRTISDLTQTIYKRPLVVSNAALQANISITKMPVLSAKTD
jgi:hypothetical protein